MFEGRKRYMILNHIYQEPCLETLKRMPDNFLDCVITSPPYWQLRDYGYKGQWGLELTFQLYLEHLWSMMDEIYRVLKPTGTVWVNLGDTYSSNSGGMGLSDKNRITGGQAKFSKEANVSMDFIQNKQTDIQNKCLLLIPHRFAIGCIDRGWIMRNDVIWAKRNGMPESVTDRFSKKHEYFFFMVKNEKYHFDLDAIKDKIENPGKPRAFAKNGNNDRNDTGRIYNPESITGKNPGSVSDFWDIPTKPSSEKHYASYNDSLLVKPVLAGCPEGGIIYDPFMGTGSTAEVAIRSNRKYIGSEMSKDYCKIANDRLRKFHLQPTMF